MARTYKRDSNGRFASTGTTRSGPKARMATRGTNRLTRDNSGRITSVGGQGATARGGRLRTASGAKRGAVVARLSLQRGGVIGKPKGLKVGVITERIMNKDQAIIASSYKRIERAQQRRRKLNSIQREIDYRRANPVGGRAARGQLTKRLNKQQKKLNKSMDTVFSAIELSYKPRISAAENRLRQMIVAKTATSGLRTSRRGAVLQRSIFGGATATYR